MTRSSAPEGDAGAGLVEQHQVGLAYEGHGNVHQLLLAAGRLAGLQVRHVPDTELFDQRVRAGAQARVAGPAHPSSDLMPTITLPNAVSPLK